MNRFFGAFVLAAGVAVTVGACDDSSSGGYGYGGGASQCSNYATCDTCTPANGCGWCFNSSGGMCASDPDQCSSASEFTWTWDPSGCPGVDASVSAIDAGAPTTEAAAPASEASAPANDSGTAVVDGGTGPSEASAGD